MIMHETKESPKSTFELTHAGRLNRILQIIKCIDVSLSPFFLLKQAHALLTQNYKSAFTSVSKAQT